MEDITIKFKTTERGTKKYEYRDNVWSLNDQLNLDYVLKLNEFSKFKHAATIIKSNCTAGYSIKLEPEFINEPFVIYIIEKCGKILKGGKSKNSLDLRSYGAGTEESWTMKGTCSQTNYVWSQIFRESLVDGCEIKFYGLLVPSVEYTFESFDGTIEKKLISPYEEEEKKLNSLLNKLNGKKVIGEGKLLELRKK